MMGHKQGVQKRLFEINNNALCVTCSSHSLNLVVADAAKSSRFSLTFFGILQHLYNIFSSSVQRWSILQSHMQLTVKNLSTTRWECWIDSVKALYHQLPETVDATEKRDRETLSVAQNLCKDLTSWQVVLCIVIWYNVLYQINRTSKLQSPKMWIDVLKQETDNAKLSPRVQRWWTLISSNRFEEELLKRCR